MSTLCLQNARMKFRVSSNLLQTVREHYPRKYRGKSLACPGCLNSRATNGQSANDLDSSCISQNKQPTDSIPHILVCESYSDLRNLSFDPNDDEMLTEFFIKVVTRRIENGEDLMLYFILLLSISM